MANTYEKVDGVLRRTKQETPAPQINDFKLEFLIEQKKAIQAQWDSQLLAINTARGKEMTEVDEMISECGKLGIKVAEPTEVIG